MTAADWWDAVRVLVLTMYGLTVGQTAWVIRSYLRIAVATRRLLPSHVLLVSVSLIGFETVAAWETTDQFGSGFTPYIPLNIALFGLALTALTMVRVHVNRKRDLTRQILPLVQDPNEMP